MKGLISAESLGQADLLALVAKASGYRELIDAGRPVERALSGWTMANLFFEPSTRTRLSFDLAAQRLGAHVLTLDPGTASSVKGESLRDTVATVASIGADILVVRHAVEGVPQTVSDWTGLPVINAGDGVNEHPTQALLDAVTIQARFGRVDGLRVGIVGDIVHSRVAHSLTLVLQALGADLTLIAPSHWLPDDSQIPKTTELDLALGDLDVVYLLRVQTERGGEITEEFKRLYQLDKARAALLHEGAVIMHPGPMNRGVEIAEDVAESPRSLVSEQVRNGVPTRMAVLESVAGAGR